MATQKKGNKEVDEVMGIRNGDPATPPPATVEATPAPKEEELVFEKLPGSGDFAFKFVNFETNGSTFTGKWVRAYAKGELVEGYDEPLKYSALMFERYGTGELSLLPGNQALWEKFVDEIEPTRGAEGTEDGTGKNEGFTVLCDRTGGVFRLTRIEKIEKEGKNPFVKFSIEEARVRA